MNIFDESDREFIALRNREEQYSLWPAHFAVPLGWEVSFGPAGRETCLDHIRDAWSDMRPRSLRVAMSSSATLIQ